MCKHAHKNMLSPSNQVVPGGQKKEKEDQMFVPNIEYIFYSWKEADICYKATIYENKVTTIQTSFLFI